MRVRVRFLDILDIVCSLAKSVQVQQRRCAQLSKGGRSAVACASGAGGNGDLVQRGVKSTRLDIANGLLQNAGQRLRRGCLPR